MARIKANAHKQDDIVGASADPSAQSKESTADIDKYTEG